MTRDISTGHAELAQKIIDEVGSDFLQKTFNRSAGAVSLWKKNGMPRLVEMYMQRTYPALRAFGGQGELGISRF